MNRRKFLTTSLGAPACLAASSSPKETDPQDSQSSATSSEPSREMTPSLILEDLHDRFRRDLFDDFLPFMDKYVIDREYGGFMCNTDRDGTNLSRNKTSWYEGRGIWVYSFLHNHVAQDDRYLEVARKSVDFILKNEPQSSEGRWPKAFTREGKPLSPPCSDVYGDLFIAEGLAEYSVASGKEEYREKARDILFRCVRIYDQTDYLPEIGQTYLGPDARPFPGARILGHWMVFLRIATQMLRYRQDEGISRLADRCIEAVMESHFNPAFDLTNELINHDLSRPDNEYAQLVYTGHAIETLWMVMDEAERRGDGSLFREAARRFHRHFLVAWDDVYGGVFRNLQNVDKNIWSVDKVLWAQEEVLIGALLAMEHLGTPWAWDVFSTMDAYIQEKFPLRRHGYSLYITSADRKVSFEKHATRVENFHHPRCLMLVLMGLERLIERGGKTSGRFG